MITILVIGMICAAAAIATATLMTSAPRSTRWLLGVMGVALLLLLLWLAATLLVVGPEFNAPIEDPAAG